MKRLMKVVLALSMGAVLLLTGLPAVAQEEEFDTFTLDDIIVTATKREESVFEVPLTVSAFDGEKIEELGMISMDDLNMLAPGLQIGESSEMRDQGWVIRGIGSRLWGENHSDQAVAFYVDGVYQYAPIGLAPGMFDIKRIEVARGPQGTLHGRNSIAGSVSWFNKKPTADWDMNLVAEWTDQFSERYGVAFGGPLLGNLRFRFTGHYNKGEGTQKNIGPGPDLGAKDDLYHAEQLRYKSDRFDINLRYAKTHNKGKPRMLLNLATLTEEDTMKMWQNERAQAGYNPFYLWNFDELGDPFPATSDCDSESLPYSVNWNDTAAYGMVPGDTRFYWYNKCNSLKNVVNLDYENRTETINESASFSFDWHVTDWLSARFVYGRSRVSTVSSREQDNNSRTTGWDKRVEAGEYVDWPPAILDPITGAARPARYWFHTPQGMGGEGLIGVTDQNLSGWRLSSDAGVLYWNSWYENPYNLFQQSGELVLFSDFDGPINFIVGAFYYNNHTSYEHNVYNPTLWWQDDDGEYGWLGYNEATSPHTWDPNVIIGQNYGGLAEGVTIDEWGPKTPVAHTRERFGQTGDTSYGWYPFTEEGCNEFLADWALFTGDESPAVCLWGDQPSDRWWTYHYQTRAVQETKGIFLHLGWQLGEEWSIAGGARYTEDSKRKLGDEFWQLLRWGVNNADQFPYWATNQEEAHLFPMSWDRIIWDLAVEYNFNQYTMAYVRLASGYRAGGPQNIISEEIEIAPIVDEETLINYEIGLKGALFDQKLWYTAGAFYSPYEGFQLDQNQEYPAGTPIPVTDNDPLLSYISNIDGTKIWGAEVEFTWQPTERWKFSGSYIYMDSELGHNKSVSRGDPDPIRGTWYSLYWPPVGFDGTTVPGDVLVITDTPQDPLTNEFLAPLTREESLARSIEEDLPCKGRTGGGTQWACWGQSEVELPKDFTGNQLAMQPNHKWSLTASYTMPLPNLGMAKLRDMGYLQLLSTYSYTGLRHPYISNLPAHEMPGYGELNVRASWWSPSGRFVATLYVANALDDINLVSYTPASTAGESPGTSPDSTALLSNPRRIGFVLRYKYGS